MIGTRWHWSKCRLNCLFGSLEITAKWATGWKEAFCILSAHFIFNVYQLKACKNTSWCRNVNKRGLQSRRWTRKASGHLPVVDSRGQLLLSLIPVSPQAKVLILLLLFGLYFYDHPRCSRCRPSHIIKKQGSAGERGLRTTPSYRAATHSVPLWWKPLVWHYTACVCLKCIGSENHGGGRARHLVSVWNTRK